ncbi:MAG: outer membrane beta-barrel protein [Gemmatimonadales bacterium]
MLRILTPRSLGLAWLAAAALLAAPQAADAQVRLLAGGGLSTPVGDFGDVAEAGWHLTGGMTLGVPTIPVALRADGSFHSFGQASGSPSVDMLGGGLSLVVNLPGVGLVPYVLGGVDTFRTTVEGSDAVSDNGFHAAFGVNIGAIGFGGFGEVRFVNVKAEAQDARFVTATLGFRL